MNTLKFKETPGDPEIINDDFFYMVSDGGYLKPEDYLEPEDAIRVRAAIDLLEQYKEQGIEQGYFEEI